MTVNAFCTEAEVLASSQQLSSKLGSEVVILDLKSGVYYGLNEVGACVWEMIQNRPQPISAIRDAIVSQFDVEPQQCEQDLLDLLQDMKANGLVQIVQP